MISVYLLLDYLNMSARLHIHHLLHICIFAHSSALHHLHFPNTKRKLKTQAQNASSNGGDASRVGKICSYYLVDLSLARRETRLLKKCPFSKFGLHFANN